ncbi:MAG TPA: hypothetical protein VH255_10175 [Verrucomicrobiae bacterium]|nr:hypothetical protein [Verrucomicrobiae bacterium]
MSKSLQQHGIKENYKQLRLRMKTRGLDTVDVAITRRAGKYIYDFTGSADQVAKAQEMLASWT